MANKVEGICTYYGEKNSICQFGEISIAERHSAKRFEKRLHEITGASLSEKYMVELEARIHRMPSLTERSGMTGILFCRAAEYRGQISDAVGKAQQGCSEYKEGEPRDIKP